MLTAILLMGLYAEAVRFAHNPPAHEPRPATVAVVEPDGWIVDVPIPRRRYPVEDGKS